MPTWNELLNEFNKQPTPEAKIQWLDSQRTATLLEIGRLRGTGGDARNVIFYGSAFLQKPGAPELGITWEDVNAFMSVVHGMDCTRGLTLLIHTPGGQVNAAESLVAYLRSKFDDIEAIIPTFAMSAGTMISLSTKRIVMGRQSQLGPIDPQFQGPQGSVSATAVTDVFDRAKKDIEADLNLAHLWAPILQTLGPSLLVDARHALSYGERMVAGWLETGMLAGTADAAVKAAEIAHHFNDASAHLSHGRRIDIDEARRVGVTCEQLEGNQALQEAVLTAYHLMTITFDIGPAVRAVSSDAGKTWLRNFFPPQFALPMP